MNSSHVCAGINTSCCHHAFSATVPHIIAPHLSRVLSSRHRTPSMAVSRAARSLPVHLLSSSDPNSLVHFSPPPLDPTDGLASSGGSADDAVNMSVVPVPIEHPAASTDIITPPEDQALVAVTNTTYVLTPWMPAFGNMSSHSTSLNHAIDTRLLTLFTSNPSISSCSLFLSPQCPRHHPCRLAKQGRD